MTKPSFLITHSWSHNMGDTAILLATVDMLHSIAPGCSVSALASHPSFTKERCPRFRGHIDAWPWPVPAGRPGLLDLAYYPVLFMGNLLSAAAYRLFGARLFVLNGGFSGPLTRFFESDVVISPGGDFIGPHYFFMTAFGEMLMAKILGKRLVVCAQTIGPFRGLLHRRLASAVLGMADLIIVREERTAQRLREAGLKDVHVTSDIAFTFPQPKKRQRKAGRVILCPKKLREGREDYAQAMVALGRKIAAEGCEVVLVASDAYDAGLHAEIARGIGPQAKLVGAIHPPDRLAGYIAGSDFIVSSRMHAIILGSLSHTPFFAIGDSHKFQDVLGDLCQGCSMDAGELDEKGIERVLDSFGRREELRASISESFPSVKEKASRSGLILREKLTEWGL
ncbi:MAG: polysaccharide pyruvyl transferase family protein [Candidatus Micrarchaeota archaeon]